MRTSLVLLFTSFLGAKTPALDALIKQDRMDITVLMRRAALAYKDARYEEMLAKLPAEEVQANRMQILWKK